MILVRSGDGAGDDGGGRRGEDHLEEPAQDRIHVVGVAGQEEPGVADDRVTIVETGGRFGATPHEGKTERPVRERSHAEVEETLGEIVHRVLGADKAGAQEGEAGLHEEHEEGGHEHPREVRRPQRVLAAGITARRIAGRQHSSRSQGESERAQQQAGPRPASRCRAAPGLGVPIVPAVVHPSSPSLSQREWNRLRVPGNRSFTRRLRATPRQAATSTQPPARR